LRFRDPIWAICHMCRYTWMAVKRERDRSEPGFPE
jgi:hypothetical protein